MDEMNRRATDLPGYTTHKSLAEYLDKMLIGAIGLILVGLGWLIQDFAKKVDNLAEKVGKMTEAVVAVKSDQGNYDRNFTRLDTQVQEHFREDRLRFAKTGIK